MQVTGKHRDIWHSASVGDILHIVVRTWSPVTWSPVLEASRAAYCLKEEEGKGWGFFSGEEAMILLVQSGLVFVGSLRVNPGHLSQKAFKKNIYLLSLNESGPFASKIRLFDLSAVFRACN